jgi:dTDP-4-dehydrorhamnose 3,5-epimerase
VRFEETLLTGAFVIDIEPIEDDRGFFARAWCRRELEAHGLNSSLAQANLSFNRHKGTLRGMHWQEPPHAESKLVRCTRGAIFDVAVDLRPGSVTYLQWVGAELSADNHRMLLVPEGFAHGFQTLADDTEVFYQVSEFYAPQAERGARYNDPSFNIQWPLGVAVISDKDAAWPDFATD